MPKATHTRPARPVAASDVRSISSRHHGDPRRSSRPAAANVRWLSRVTTGSASMDGHQLRFARRLADEGLIVLCEQRDELTAALDAARRDPDNLTLVGGAQPGQPRSGWPRQWRGSVGSSTSWWSAPAARRAQAAPVSVRTSAGPAMLTFCPPARHGVDILEEHRANLRSALVNVLAPTGGRVALSWAPAIHDLSPTPGCPSAVCRRRRSVASCLWPSVRKGSARQ